MSFKSRVLPPNSVWMEDAGLKSLTVCTLDHRNTFNKIFGGFIMRKARGLAGKKCLSRNSHVSKIKR